MSSSGSAAPTPVQSRSQLERLTKKQVTEYAIKIGENYEKLYEQLFNPESGVVAKLQSQLIVASKVNEVLNDRLVRVERNTNLNSQYLRKETLELHKFPENIKDGDLENKVVEILNETKEPEDPPYTPMDFHACHRLANRKRVIVKMTHRKKLRAIVKSRVKLAKPEVQQTLKIGRIYLVESLAGPYKFLLYKCQQLKIAQRIHDCWFFNGNINVVLENGGDRHHISHLSDILKLIDVTEEELSDIIKAVQ